MEWKKLRRKIQVPAYIQFFISTVFWIAAGLRLYGTRLRFMFLWECYWCVISVLFYRHFYWISFIL